jgi:dephospho-CoA kinase
MFTIGLTGGIACGKTTLAHALRCLGAPVVDADEIAHSLTKPGGAALPGIRKRFGNVLFHGEVLDRAQLGELVFSDPAARQALEAIVHPLVIQAMERCQAALAQMGACAAVLDVPLLFETGLEGMASEIWVAYLPQAEQLRRLMARDGLTEPQALARIRSQMPLRDKCRRADVLFPMTVPRPQAHEMAAAQWARVRAIAQKR